jgi:hypothetical protein
MLLKYKNVNVKVYVNYNVLRRLWIELSFLTELFIRQILLVLWFRFIGGCVENYL